MDERLLQPVTGLDWLGLPSSTTALNQLQMEPPSGPPYAPKVAGVGGQPTVGVDVPICAVFILLFACLAAGHMATLQINMRKRHHKFLYSGLLFGFCMSRLVTCSLRIAWASHTHNVSLAIAAQIFVNAGVLIMYIVNLIFAQRILRATHPDIGFHRATWFAFCAMFVAILIILALIITCTVQSFFTLDPNILRIDRDGQLAASAYILFFAFMPVPILLFSLLVPSKVPRQDFGTGKWSTKLLVLGLGLTMALLESGFRSGTSFRTPPPLTHPRWYDAKWAFYFFSFVMEVGVLSLYLVARVDRMFWVPDGSKHPGDYHRLDERPKGDTESDMEKSYTDGSSK